VADQLAAPVPIGVHLRMRGDGPGEVPPRPWRHQL
jgi:hypothetical protein